MALSATQVVPITSDSIRDGTAFFWTVRLRRREQYIALTAFTNLGTAARFEKLQADIHSAAMLLAAGKLDHVFYSEPFRLTGWTWHEWWYWLLIRYFQKKVNEAGIRRRIQHAPAHMFPKKFVTCIDGAAYIREKHPDIFRRLTRIAVKELFPYLKDPKGCLDAERQGFLRGQSCSPDEDIRREYLEAHLLVLRNLFWSHKKARVSFFAPTETAYGVLEFLLTQGFRIVV